ncbi:hypothetical protein GV792_15775 [Nocardia cyriacigeorgica]|uniref:Uncharacterized protein n=1 Tax=Nocardia cyriacigeorgica TaxID=135487 RepID=A0A6P1D1K8_9NOCA|nr:hypothetical protein [Nocardia cyriacigeorgica]NEW40174.1 hypothetical protein [Nocardia cyriacigeorgica]NEW43429.1 hypothetical protein [Nocardia cyriacigeorgica]NEW51500.1 hypothetical protein [Nocardia cyriacigeorgica]
MSVHRMIAAVGIAAGMTLAGMGGAGAQPPEPESPLTQYMKMLPPAPAWCAGVWDPIEDRIEDMVPPQAKDAFDAFDDWCEGEAD